MSRWVASKHWKSKKSAKHFTSKKHREAARDVKRWLAKSKTPSDRSPGA